MFRFRSSVVRHWSYRHSKLAMPPLVALLRFVAFPVVLSPEHEHEGPGDLLDRAGLPQIGEVDRCPRFESARESTVPIDSKEQWYVFWAERVGASEASALFEQLPI